eukprot:gene41643-52276_t
MRKAEEEESALRIVREREKEEQEAAHQVRLQQKRADRSPRIAHREPKE